MTSGPGRVAQPAGAPRPAGCHRGLDEARHGVTMAMASRGTRPPSGGAAAGLLGGILPYNRMGAGPRTLVVLQGLTFEHRSLSALEAPFALWPYRAFAADFTVYVVNRRPNVPPDHGMDGFAREHAEALRAAFGGPVDVLGVSTGGSVALQLAADHPDVVRRLVIQSGACRLGPDGRALQRRVARLARSRRRLEIGRIMLGSVLPDTLPGRATARLAGTMFAATIPADPADAIATIEAEDRFDLEPRLGEIRALTLVAAGTTDFYYPADLVRRTAAGIPGARLVLYEGQGHPARGRRFEADVRAFLVEPEPAAAPARPGAPA